MSRRIARCVTRAATLVVLLVAASSCSLIFPLDGYAGAADAAATDGGARDAGACTIFCDDFDGRTTLQGAWTQLIANGSGSLANASLASTDCESPPSCAHFFAPVQTAGSHNGVQLYLHVPFAQTTLSVDFDAKVVSNDQIASGYDTLVNIAGGVGFIGAFVGGGAGQSVNYHDNFSDGGQPPYDTPKTDQNWHHIHYEVVFSPTDGSVAVTYDGAPLFSHSNIVTTSSTHPMDVLDFYMGVDANEAADALDVYFDNVAIR